MRASRSLPFPSHSSNFPGVNQVAPNLARAPEGVAGHRELTRTKSNSPRGQPYVERVGTLHRSARTRRNRQRAQRGVLRRGFACAILCARKGDCDEFGERAAMARRSREGKTVHRTPGAGKARADPVDGLRGQETLAASHAGIDYGSTMLRA